MSKIISMIFSVIQRGRDNEMDVRLQSLENKVERLEKIIKLHLMEAI